MRKVLALGVALVLALLGWAASPAQAAVPDAPVITGVAPASGLVQITFNTVAGASSYTYSIDGGTPVAAGNPLGFNVTSLTNGQTYCFRMFATNSDGTSTASSPRCAIPNNPATAATAIPVITNVTASANALTVSYTRANDGFAVDSYNIWLNGAHYMWIYDFTSPMTIPGLSTDSAYSVQIKASGPAGAPDSTFSAPYSARTEPGAAPAPAISQPEPPGITLTKVGDGTVSFTIIPPANDGGQTPTQYRYTINGVTTQVNPNDLSRTVTGLTNGTTYTITTNAENSAGWGAPGVATARPVGPAGPPQEVRAVGAVRAGTISWQPPVNDGGYPVNGYSVLHSDGTTACTASADQRSCLVTNLRSVTNYSFRVVAITALGVGAASPSTSMTTPAAAPLAPTDLEVTPFARRSVKLTWKRPVDDGGQRLRYHVRYERTEGNAVAYTCYSTETSCVIEGILQNQAYTYVVRQSSPDFGAATELAKTFTLTGDMPQKARQVRAVQRGESFVVSWEPPANAGTAVISNYQVRMFIDDVRDQIGHLSDEIVCKVKSTARSCTTRALAPRLHYRFDVFALDSEGDRNLPAATSLQPLKSMPVAPLTLADAGNGMAQITVVDNASSMWREADSFQVTRVDDWFGLVTSPACTIVKPETSCTVTGLENGTGYRFYAVATNPAGTSPVGLPSQVVEPSAGNALVTLPSAPRNPRATTRVAVAVSPQECGCTGVPVGTPRDKLPRFSGDAINEVWMGMNVSWDRPTDVGGARDVVYTATLTRYTVAPGLYRAFYELPTFTCTTRELNCEIRVPFYTGSLDSDSYVYVMSITATNSAGSRSTDLWQVTPKGTLAPIPSAG